mgnify:CR=1 FL=1
MATVQDITARLEALRATRASGQRKMKHGDREIEYRSDAEIAAAIADLERQLADAVRPRPKNIVFTMNKGV